MPLKETSVSTANDCIHFDKSKKHYEIHKTAFQHSTQVTIILSQVSAAATSGEVDYFKMAGLWRIKVLWFCETTGTGEAQA